MKRSGKGKGEGKGGAASPGLRPKKVAFYRAMTVTIQREYGFSRVIRVDGLRIPIILHEDPFWRVTEPETGTTITNGCMTRKEAADSARERILKVGVDAFKAGREAWKRIVLDGLSISEYARKKATLSGSRIVEYKAWVEEFKSAQRSAEPKAKPSKSSPKASPRNPKATPRTRRAGA